MKTVLLITALLICAWPAGAFAGDPPPPGDHLRKTVAVSQSAEAPGAKVKVFIHPETGEILTRDQWEALGIGNDEAEATPRYSSEPPEMENAPTVLKGRRIDLGNGDYIIAVDDPDSEMVKTKTWFDDEGEIHIRCTH